jgi:hypothetical protein
MVWRHLIDTTERLNDQTAKRCCFVDLPCVTSRYSLVLFSEAMCYTDMPAECKPVIPYTTYPNEPLQLFDEAAYRNLTERVWMAAQSCNNTEAIVWGACNAIYPRCLLGHPLHLCRQTCLGKPRPRCGANALRDASNRCRENFLARPATGVS